MDDLEIIIKGKPKSGKTLLASLLKLELQQKFGALVNWNDVDMPRYCDNYSGYFSIKRITITTEETKR